MNKTYIRLLVVSIIFISILNILPSVFANEIVDSGVWHYSTTDVYTSEAHGSVQSTTIAFSMSERYFLKLKYKEGVEYEKLTIVFDTNYGRIRFKLPDSSTYLYWSSWSGGGVIKNNAGNIIGYFYAYIYDNKIEIYFYNINYNSLNNNEYLYLYFNTYAWEEGGEVYYLHTWSLEGHREISHPSQDPYDITLSRWTSFNIYDFKLDELSCYFALQYHISLDIYYELKYISGFYLLNLSGVNGETFGFKTYAGNTLIHDYYDKSNSSYSVGYGEPVSRIEIFQNAVSMGNITLNVSTVEEDTYSELDYGFTAKVYYNNGNLINSFSYEIYKDGMLIKRDVGHGGVIKANLEKGNYTLKIIEYINYENKTFNITSDFPQPDYNLYMDKNAYNVVFHILCQTLNPLNQYDTCSAWSLINSSSGYYRKGYINHGMQLTLPEGDYWFYFEKPEANHDDNEYSVYKTISLHDNNTTSLLLVVKLDLLFGGDINEIYGNNTRITVFTVNQYDEYVDNINIKVFNKNNTLVANGYTQNGRYEFVGDYYTTYIIKAYVNNVIKGVREINTENRGNITIFMKLYITEDLDNQTETGGGVIGGIGGSGGNITQTGDELRDFSITIISLFGNKTFMALIISLVIGGSLIFSRELAVMGLLGGIAFFTWGTGWIPQIIGWTLIVIGLIILSSKIINYFIPSR